MIWLDDKNVGFPPHEFASEEGILALGGDLSSERLILAYKNGIFPWYNEGEPIIWYSPSKRMVLFPDEVKISKSMRQILKKQNFEITENKAFDQVIHHCKTAFRKGQFGTWITNAMEDAYSNLHKKGLAKSIEVWQVTATLSPQGKPDLKDDTSNPPSTKTEKKLIAGLYGIDLGNGVFCGESMFSKTSNMSKVAFIHLAQNCNYELIDCQVHNSHLESLGAREISRAEFLKYL